jgi:hypothetical protein
MPAWSSIALADCYAYGLRPAIDAAFNHAEDDTERDAWFAVLRGNVVARIRAKIQRRTGQALDATTTTVPPEFAELATLRTLEAIYDRANSLLGDNEQRFRLTQGQRDRLDDLETELNEVTVVTTPATAESTPAVVFDDGAPAPSMSAPTRTWSRDDQDGV